MRRLFIIIILIVSLFSVQPAQGQSTMTIEELEIGLWPEYDRQDVLVIFRISLAADVTLPAQMSIRIPRDAGAPYNLAMKDMDGLLYNLAYSTEVQDEWLKIIFTTPSAELQLEYYDPGLTKTDRKREFEYIWPGDYTVNNLVLVVQQPNNATAMQILPDFGSGSAGEDGLIYYSKIVGEVRAGTPLTVGFSYNKADDELSFGSQSMQPVQASGGDASGRVNATDILPWVIGGVGLVLVLGGFLWFMLSRNRGSAVGSTGKRRHRTSTRPLDKRSNEYPDGPVYCSQCGRKAAPADMFCRTCGNRLRTE